MKLNEWKQVNNTTSTGSSSSSAVSNNSFKKRFNKLINYYEQHLPKEVSYLDVGLTTKDTLAFSEVYKKGDKIDFNISITDFDDESWIVKVEADKFRIATLIGSGWTNLLKKLRAYITVPVVGTPEYTDLLQESLTEWVAMKNNSSTGYEKRFEKLIRYHIDHASDLESITKKEVEPDGFHLSEHYNTGSLEFDRDVVVSVDETTGTLTFSVFVDGARVCQRKCKDYDEFVSELGDSYMYLAPAGTPEYDELLTEWLDSKGNKISLNNSSSVSTISTSYKDKFKKLLDYHIAHDYHIKRGSSQGTIESLSEDNDKALFKFKEVWEDGQSKKHEHVIAAAYFKGDSTWWVLEFKDGKQTEDFVGDKFNELIKKLYRYLTLPPTNSPEYQELLESINTIADDFKTYENLWD